MKNFINILVDALLYIWQLPQNIIGLFVILFTNPEKKIKMDNGNILYIADKMSASAFMEMAQWKLLEFKEMFKLILTVYLGLGVGIGVIGSGISMRKYLEV